MTETRVVRNIGQLLTMDGTPHTQGDAFRRIDKAAMVIEKGQVAWTGPESMIPPSYQGDEVDAEGALVTPGLVDSHTHLLYAGERAYEVKLRAEGRSYLEILEAGGGILSTVEKTRAAHDEELMAATRKRLRRALAHGSTTVEVKTGYDLTVAGEMRMLGLIRRLAVEGPWRLKATSLAAHAVPPEFRGKPAAYLAHLTQELLPELPGKTDFVDIFCEPGVFDVAQSRPYLEAAKRWGLAIKLHVDELADGGGAQLAASLGAVSADHCALTTPEGFRAMAERGVVAVILPGTARYLDHGHMADARAMIEAGGLVALGSDGNPGSSPTEAVGPLMPWAASWLRLTPEEVWTGVTVAGARALRSPAGTLATGAPADFLIWDADDYQVPCYHYGVNLVQHVFVAGSRVFGEGRAESSTR